MNPASVPSSEGMEKHKGKRVMGFFLSNFLCQKHKNTAAGSPWLTTPALEFGERCTEGVQMPHGSSQDTYYFWVHSSHSDVASSPYVWGVCSGLGSKSHLHPRISSL